MAGEHAGKSIIEELWGQADAQYAKLKELYLNDETDTEDYLRTEGKVQALAFAVGTVLDLYASPKERIDKVRPMLAERWADANLDEEE